MLNSVTLTLFTGVSIVAWGGLVEIRVQEKPLSSVGSAAQAAQPEADTITARGCLVRVDRSAHRPGTTSSSPGSDGPEPTAFLLKWATTSRDQGGLEAKGSQREFGVRGDRSKLEPQVGHEVEIEGRLVSARAPSPRQATSSPADAKKESAPKTATSDGRLNTGGYDVEVVTVRTLSDECRR